MISFACILVLGVGLSYGFDGGNVYGDEILLSQNEAYEISQSIVVQENASLTLQPGVKMVFSGNTSMIVHGVLVANGTKTSQITFASIVRDASQTPVSVNSVLSRTSRLVDGNGYNEGRLEVHHDGVWGNVCDDRWSELNSLVACRELGFVGGTFTQKFGAGTGMIWMDDVRCSESDTALVRCAHNGFGSHNCGELFSLIFGVLFLFLFSKWFNVLSSIHGKQGSVVSYLFKG